VKPVYIHSAVAISAQDSFNLEVEFARLSRSVKKVPAIHPIYRDFISPSSLRRMAPVVKMGVAAAKKALQQAELTAPDAIITGSGMGCMEDTEKFLNTLIANNESFLTPTAFIQSTHNTVGAQIALDLKCKGYNTTYVHGSLSFESALLDSQMLIQEEAISVLVGGVDELGTEFVDYVLMLEAKKDNPMQIPFSEGAAFFVLSSEKKKSSVQLIDIQTTTIISEENIIPAVKEFLKSNGLEPSDIDAVFTGNRGDAFDNYYKKIESDLFSEIESVHFKEFSGEYYTASAFGMWMAYQLIANQTSLDRFQTKKSFENVLIYNQENGKNHSFVLLSKC